MAVEHIGTVRFGLQVALQFTHKAMSHNVYYVYILFMS